MKLTPPASPRPNPLEEEPIAMASTEERLRQPGRGNLGLDHEPDSDRTFSNSGVSSVESVASFKVANDEFQLNPVAGEGAEFETLRNLTTHIDSRAG